MPTAHIPTEIQQAFEDSAQYFPTPIQQFQYFDKYARFNYTLGRRETWKETVDRAVDFLKELSKEQLPDADYERIRGAILRMEASPSMRLLAMAGPAARRNNIAIYNCSYLPMDSIESFKEELLIAMAGCGVGFSVESRYVDQLPAVKRRNFQTKMYDKGRMIIEDSTEGWAEALWEGIDAWFDGEDIKFDFGALRSAGTVLKIKGGRASGPGPLKDLLKFTKKIIRSRAGKKLRPIDAHRIACKIGEAIVAGGVRRTALISLFDYDDKEMLECKNGENPSPELWKSNNSAVWPDDVSDEQIALQMVEMRDGMRGEPGIFSRANANSLRPDRRQAADFGTNPCGEINLRPYEFCNLSIAIARSDDTEESLREKVEIATIIGTIQSMGTYFPGLRDVWKKNCEEERLLGVDINGQMDSPAVRSASVQRRLKELAIATNAKYAEFLGIPKSAAITCVKPSGNSGVLFNCASGLHGRWAKYYIRRARVQAASPICALLEKQGVPMAQDIFSKETFVIDFPMAAPDGAITRNDLSAIEQCEYWLLSKTNWTEHNPSVTITYRPQEFEDLVKWIQAHKQYIGGMSFLPNDDAKYDQAPNEEISQAEYEKLVSEFPVVDFSQLWALEKEDYTTASTELACVNGQCDIADYLAVKESQLPIPQAQPYIVV